MIKWHERGYWNHVLLWSEFFKSFPNNKANSVSGRPSEKLPPKFALITHYAIGKWEKTVHCGCIRLASGSYRMPHSNIKQAYVLPGWLELVSSLLFFLPFLFGCTTWPFFLSFLAARPNMFFLFVQFLFSNSNILKIVVSLKS